jgi:hypothetical protein
MFTEFVYYNRLLMQSLGFSIYYNVISSLFLFIFLVGLGFELRDLSLQIRHFTTGATASPFCSGYYGDGGLKTEAGLQQLSSRSWPPK